MVLPLYPVKELRDFVGDKFVMVIEPSANYRTSIKQFLANLKLSRVKHVVSVADARREMLTTRVGFFVVEWGLESDINGLQFCRELRKEPTYQNVPFLLMSVENLRRDVILAAEIDIDGYLLKPFSYEEFCNQVFSILKKHTNPDPVKWLLDKAERHLRNLEFETANGSVDDALKIRPDSARAYCVKARVEHQRGNAERALKYLYRSTKLNPEYIEAHRVILAISQSRNDRAGIIQSATVLNSLSPENPRYSLILANAYLELSHLSGAEQYFRKTIALSPRLAEAFKGLGNVYMIQEEYEKAMKNYKRALDLDQDDLSLLNSIGLAYVRLRMYKEGINRYLMALRMQPHDSRVLFNIGHAYEKKGDFVQAKSYYGQALLHQPGYAKALRGLNRLKKQNAQLEMDEFEFDFKKTS